MTGPPAWVDESNQALLTDLYQLTMIQAYWREGMHREAVFTLFCRRLPEQRKYLLACGLDDALRVLETLRFHEEGLDYLASLPWFYPAFIAWLRDFRFTGDVYAVPEGTPVFADEPILEVVAPLPQAQLAETLIINQLHLQTMLASKAARVVAAAAGRPVIDFGLRRTHGADAGLKGARAFHVAGVAATSNVLAGHLYGVPVAGTMAHSYIQAHADELRAFRDFVAIYPDTIVLVDTYDTLGGIETLIALAAELGDAFRVRGVRLDSGDLGALAAAARRRLDEAGLQRVEILASGGLDEYEIAALVRGGAPIDGFGVGTAMGVSSDAPSLDFVYKLAAYDGEGRVKTSPGKPVLPGRKQIFRAYEEGRATGDVIGRWDEELPDRRLLRQVMSGGRRLPAGDESLEVARERASTEVAGLPAGVRSLEPGGADYPVAVSEALRAYHEQVVRETGRA